MTQSRRNHVGRLVAVTAWCLIASALVWSNLSASDVPALGHPHLTVGKDWIERYGWPAQYLVRFPTVTGSRSGPLIISVTATWSISGLLLDSAVFLFILGGTALVLKNWLRSPRLMQLRLKTVMIMIAVIAVLMTLYRARDALNAMMLQWRAARHLWAIPMYLKLPLSIGLGCVVFVVISSGVNATGRLMHIWQHRRWCETSVGESGIADPKAENALDSRTDQPASRTACGNLDTSVQLNSRMNSSEPP